MKKITIIIAMILSFSGMFFVPVQAENSLQKVRNYFSGKKRITMTGIIAISGEDKIYFKNESGELFRLEGNQAKNFIERKGDTVQITGYMKKHSYEVRRYKIIKEYVEPEPEPEVEEDISDDSNISGINDNLELDVNDDDISDDSETYTVVSGDTLGKISHKFYGTTAKWKKIAKDNNITNPKRLKIGDVLTINKDED